MLTDCLLCKWLSTGGRVLYMLAISQEARCLWSHLKGLSSCKYLSPASQYTGEELDLSPFQSHGTVTAGKDESKASFPPAGFKMSSVLLTVDSGFQSLTPSVTPCKHCNYRCSSAHEFPLLPYDHSLLTFSCQMTSGADLQSLLFSPNFSKERL